MLCAGKGGKGSKDADEDAPDVPLPDLEEVKTDMLSYVDKLKKSLTKLRGGEANPSYDYYFVA